MRDDWAWAEWGDRQTFWPAPTAWYLDWLVERAQSEGWMGSDHDDGVVVAGTSSRRPPPCVLVCSDAEECAASLRQAITARLGARCRVLTWAEVEGSSEDIELQEVWRSLTVGTRPASHAAAASVANDLDLALFRDWWAMANADVLAASNSTFSVTAAMLNQPHADTESSAMMPPVDRFWRPVPAARALVPFSPWDTQPLLRCTEAECAELYGGRGSYE